jgi:hypothetical protein
MLYNTGLEWKKSSNKRISLFGMSGVGKTFIANILRESNEWFHYSVDYRIGTRYLGEEIVDNFKKEAMKIPFLREHLLNDSIYLSSNITFNNLSPLSGFLGKPGNPSSGGIDFNEYVLRQRKHYNAEINATNDTALFSQKSIDIYGYKHFISDTSGSLCEVVNPENSGDKILKALQKNTLPVWVKGSQNQTDQLLERFKKSPKPMFYNERFLKEKWAEYLMVHNENPDEVEPNNFMSYGFNALILRRLPIYEKIATNWGVTLQATDITELTTPDDLIEIIAEAVDKKNLE